MSRECNRLELIVEAYLLLLKVHRISKYKPSAHSTLGVYTPSLLCAHGFEAHTAPIRSHHVHFVLLPSSRMRIVTMQLGQKLVFESIEDIVERLLLQDVASNRTAVGIDPVLEHIQYGKTLLRMSCCCSNQRARVDLPPLHSSSQPCERSFRRLLRSTPSNSGGCGGPHSGLSSRACTVGCTEARRVSQALRTFCCR